jgi:O-glycosyl hydrolase
MTKFNIGRASPLIRLGLTVTLGLTFVIGMLLLMSAFRPPDVAQAQVTTEEGLTNIYNEPSTAQAPFTTNVTITPTTISHKLTGIGVHMFDSDYLSPTFTSTLETLGLTYLRVPFGPNWDNISEAPPACNDGTHENDYPEMYDFIKRNFNNDNFDTRLTNTISISNIAQNLGMEIIFLNWQVPITSWLTDLTFRELKEDRVDDYACFVTEVIRYLTDQGVKISYLEPTNEPSITHNTKIPPALYNTFVTTLTTYLDKRDLSEIKILGPGLAYLNHDNTGITWVQALDDDGVAAISGWASHAWDPEFFPDESEVDILKTKWEEFHNAIKEKDPSKPIVITEYACVNKPGNGICTVENTLTLLGEGANAVIYWYLRDQNWDKQDNRDRALLTENFEVTSMFTALSSVLPFISGDEVEVLETQIEGRITSASFNKADNELIVALVNSYPESENVVIDINEFVGLENEVLYISNTHTITEDLGIVQCQAADNRTHCQLELESNTIMTLVFRITHLYLPIVIK